MSAASGRTWIPSRRRVQWRNGAVAQVFSGRGSGKFAGAAVRGRLVRRACQVASMPKPAYRYVAVRAAPAQLGITIARLRRYVEAGVRPRPTSSAMRLDEAKAIYRSRVSGIAMRCDELPAGLELSPVFDYGVNPASAAPSKDAASGCVGSRRSTGHASATTLLAALVAAGIAADLIATAVRRAAGAFSRRAARPWPVFGARLGPARSRRRCGAVRHWRWRKPRATSAPARAGDARSSSQERAAGATGASSAALRPAIVAVHGHRSRSARLAASRCFINSTQRRRPSMSVIVLDPRRCRPAMPLRSSPGRGCARR